MQSLYIHIPFCVKKCIYCDFYSVSYKPALAESYIKILAKQIKDLNDKFNTIYIGGGTPTSLSTGLLKELLKALNKISKNCMEFTVEANPESLSEDKIKLLKDSGVNRLSIGIQSLNDTKLQALRRIHSAECAFNSIYLARKNGFSNVSIDLIFGVWNETLAIWRDELMRAAKLPVKHISCYSLTYERHTQLFKKLKEKAIKQLPDSICAQMYKLAMDYLPEKKFRQYEISNFAKPGFECKHNLSYWENNPYLGIGTSAVSYLNGIRMKNIGGTKVYLRKLQKGESIICSKEKLSRKRTNLETAAIKIRTAKGIDFERFRKKAGFDLMAIKKDIINLLVREKLLKYHISGERITGISATKKGFLFCDYISSQLL